MAMKAEDKGISLAFWTQKVAAGTVMYTCDFKRESVVCSMDSG